MSIKKTAGFKALSRYLKGSTVLTSDQVDRASSRLAIEQPSFQRWYVDFNLWDAYQDIYSDNPIVLDAMRQSVEDKNVTKQFYCRSNMIANLDGYNEKEASDKSWNENVRAAARVVASQMRQHLDPIILKEDMDPSTLWSNESASAGLIGNGSKAQNKAECMETALRIKKMIKLQQTENCSIPAIGFHRGQISNFIHDDCLQLDKIKFKDRLVWGLDAATVTIEAQYAMPLIQFMKVNCLWYAGGKDPSTLRRIIGTARDRLDFWTSIDYSKFDQTIPSWLIRMCFGIIKCMFDSQYHPEIDWICDRFINTQLVMNGGVCFEKHKGIPSGSNFTQVVGSMCNVIMILAYFSSKVCSKEHKEDVVSNQLRSMVVMGDDNLVFTPVEIDLKDLSGYVKNVFGVRINPEKVTKGYKLQDPEFLKRSWAGNGEYQDPRYLTINTIHPERVRTYDGYSAWHIMYGLYLTYSKAFPLWVHGIDTEEYILRKMHESGGVSRLVEVPTNALPGVFRPYGRNALNQLVIRAEHMLKRAGIL